MRRLAWDKEIELYEQPPDDVIAVAKKEERSSAWLVALILLTILTVRGQYCNGSVVSEAAIPGGMPVRFTPRGTQGLQGEQLAKTVAAV